jgi:hypothetical protein
MIDCLTAPRARLWPRPPEAEAPGERSPVALAGLIFRSLLGQMPFE